MPDSLTAYQQQLLAQPKTWLVTGCAGFIGSNCLQALLALNQRVIGIDNFTTGSRLNLDLVQSAVSTEQWSGFTFQQGDITDRAICQQIMQNVDHVLHHAALVSVPLSIDKPVLTHDVNVTGTFNLMQSASRAQVKTFVYASSSAVYGDDPLTPKTEDMPTACLSPYATSKLMNELTGHMFTQHYHLACVGLRYFNIFGPRQHPHSQYGAVIPNWLDAMSRGEPVTIYGDGSTTRDFCHVDNVVRANLLATSYAEAEQSGIFNIGSGQATSLQQLLETMQALFLTQGVEVEQAPPRYQPFRPGDVQHSCASIDSAKRSLAYQPEVSLVDGLRTLLEAKLSLSC